MKEDGYLAFDGKTYPILVYVKVLIHKHVYIYIYICIRICTYVHTYMYIERGGEIEKRES